MENLKSYYQGILNSYTKEYKKFKKISKKKPTKPLYNNNQFI